MKTNCIFFYLGVVSSVGGVTRLRKISDIRNTLERANRSFDVAIENAQNAEAPQSKIHKPYTSSFHVLICFSLIVSDTNRKLMEDILRRSSENHSEMSSRVTALLAGSALTTKAGVRIERRDTVEQVDYTAVGKIIYNIKLSIFASHIKRIFPKRRNRNELFQ